MNVLLTQKEPPALRRPSDPREDFQEVRVLAVRVACDVDRRFNVDQWRRFEFQLPLDIHEHGLDLRCEQWLVLEQLQIGEPLDHVCE